MDEPHVIGEWTKISVLGSGGFGKVILWRNHDTNDNIAVKKCKFNCPMSLSSKQKQRWCNEVQIMKELNHSNIVRHKLLPLHLEQELNKYNPTKLPLLCMEYCTKGNLRHVLAQPTNLTGLREESVKNVLLDISSAVSYLHEKNITHRDIKPENIVLHEHHQKPEGIIYKLIDLGYAKELGGDSTVSFVGTLYYIAPEILFNEKYDCSVDYWSLGITAFEVICGVLPFCTNLSPIERFGMLKNKADNDICFYKSKLGNYLNSSQLFKENWISSCLKNDMEMWLQKVLKFNPKQRSVPFPNSHNVFEQLQSILRKKRVNVFCVNKYQFFSYEFDEFTELNEFKQWLSKDTNIGESEQILYSNKGYCNVQKTLLIDILSEKDNVLYLLKSSSLFDIERQQQLHVPRFVKLMFEKPTENFKWKYIKAIYSHSIHYILKDIVHVSTLNDSLRFILKHIRNDIVKISTVTNEINEQMLKMNNHKSLLLNEKLREFVEEKYLKILKACVERKLRWNFKIDIMDRMYLVLQSDVLKRTRLEQLSNDAVRLLQLAAENLNDGNNNASNAGKMARIVSEAVKLKHELFSNINLQRFVKYSSSAKIHLEELGLWMQSFSNDVKKLLELISNEEGANLAEDYVGPESFEEINITFSSWLSELIEMLESYKNICDNFHDSLGNIKK